MVVILVCCISFKVATLTELHEARAPTLGKKETMAPLASAQTVAFLAQVSLRMGTEQLDIFRVHADVLSIVLLLSVLAALVLSFILLLCQLAQEQSRIRLEARASKARHLRYKYGDRRNEEVEVPMLASDQHFHIFRTQIEC